MPLTLNTITFDEIHTSAAESHAEVGGRDARKITLTGLVLGEETLAAVEARLDAILKAASSEDYSAALSLRPGRRLWVRRESFDRAARADELAGSFTLVLEARDPFEYSEALNHHVWNVETPGAECALSSGGNVFALPAIRIEALESLVNPSVGDGTRTMEYAGTVAAGQTLVFDAAGAATLDGTDVTPYTNGVFPQIDPEGSTLRYVDAAISSHRAAISISFADRWW